MREHLVASFDEALERADRLISDMGDLAGKMVAAATYALLDVRCWARRAGDCG